MRNMPIMPVRARKTKEGEALLAYSGLEDRDLFHHIIREPVQKKLAEIQKIYETVMIEI